MKVVKWILHAIKLFFTYPLCLIGRAIAFCFRWIKLPGCVKRGWSAFYNWRPMRILRATVFTLTCILFWLIVFICADGLGLIVTYVVPPVAKLANLDMQVESCVILPLGGYVNLEGLTISNPKMFREQKPDVYVETPLLKLGQAKVDVAMLSLFKEMLTVDEIVVSGIRCFYAFDYDTTNVDQLLKEVLGEETNVEEELKEEPKAKDTPVHFMLAYVHFEDNSVTMRSSGVRLPIALPLLTMTNVDSKTFMSKVLDALKPVFRGLGFIGSGIGSVGSGVSSGVSAVSDGVMSLFSSSGDDAAKKEPAKEEAAPQK